MSRRGIPVAVLLLLTGIARAGVAIAGTSATVSSERVGAVAPALGRGERLRITGVDVPATSERIALEVERFEVFAPDAQIVVHGDGGSQRLLPRPTNVYLRGKVAGEDSSRVFLEIRPGGIVRGIVVRPAAPGDDVFLIGGSEGKSAPGSRLAAERADPALLGSRDDWRCGQERLPTVLPPVRPQPSSKTAAPSPTKVLARSARLAIETDYEFLHLGAFGGNVVAATDYVGGLVGYASTIYTAEVSTELFVGYLSLWDVATAASDPWSQTSTDCGLYEFGHYWNINHTGVNRTAAHFLSGKNLGGGVAWVGVLCAPPSFDFRPGGCPGLATDVTWFGDYGFTASLTGTFDPTAPSVMWDIYAFSHELGHEFGSPHTHCYNGILADANPIDDCYSGECKQYSGSTCVSFCYNGGSPSLPGIGTESGGSSGLGNGTIMSYCHLRPGGFSNLSLTFGAGHPYGDHPERVASEIDAEIASVAGSPTCFALLQDGFEGGHLTTASGGNWASGTSP